MKGEINILKIVVIGALVLLILGVGGVFLLGLKDNSDSGSGSNTIVEGNSNSTEEDETYSQIGTEMMEDETSSNEKCLLEYYQNTVLAGMPMLESMTKSFEYTYDQPIEIDGLSGIASYRVLDLDRDGIDEMVVFSTDAEYYYMTVYEVEADTVVKKAEKRIGTVGYFITEGTDDISIVNTETNNYVIFAGYFWGIVADGYCAEISMWKYDGNSIMPVMDIIQTGGGSSDFEYEAHHYDNNGNVSESSVIYREYAEDGVSYILDEDSSLMKSQFSRYQIDIKAENLMFSRLEDILTDTMKREVLYRENRWGEAIYPEDSMYPYVTMYFHRMTELVEQESEYVLPNSDSTYLTVNDLVGLTKEQCRIARNEIYARHGRIFTAEDLKAYFASKSWYRGSIAPENFTDDLLNEYEIYNRDLITLYEADRGYN